MALSTGNPPLASTLGPSRSAGAFAGVTTTPYSVQLEVFEGPLDLLLHLVKKHELDIFDIPISFVTEKYLEYLDYLQTLNLGVAGEYLLMAATLAYIKSRELLPQVEIEGEIEGEAADEGPDPRQELIRRLLEYQKYKEAAESLGERPVVGRNIWGRGALTRETLPEDVDPNELAPLKEVPVLKLLEALERALRKAKIRVARHDVSIDRMSVRDRINELALRLETEKEISFFSCFRFLREEVTAEEARNEAVVTFLAILEMTKLGLLVLVQSEQLGGVEEDIIIRQASDDLQEQAATLPGDDDYR